MTPGKKAVPKPTSEGLPPSMQQRKPESPTARRIPKSTPRVRGLDEITPFLRQIGKIVTEESQQHDSIDNMPWYNTWQSWIEMDLLTKTSMNSITNIHLYNLITVNLVVRGSMHVM